MLAPPATPEDDLRQVLQELGVSDDQIDAFFATQEPPPPPVMLAENQTAFDWFVDVQDCLNIEYAPGAAICTGLDLSQVAADLQLNPREYGKQDYQKLKRLGVFAAAIINEQTAA